jgi:hypothetical protein
VIGAVDISGSTVDDDQAVAEAEAAPIQAEHRSFSPRSGGLILALL